MTFKFYFSLLFSFCFFSAFAQSFEEFSFDDGINNNHIAYDADKDRVWMCHYKPNDCLRYFEGGEFTTIPEIVSYPSDMELAENGDVWVTTLDGIFQVENDGTINHFTSSNSSIVGSAIRCVTFDDAGNVYAGNSSGLWKYDGSTWAEVGSFSSVYSLVFDAGNDVMWVGKGGSYLAKLEGETVTEYTPSTSGITSDFQYVHELVLDTDGTLWLRSEFDGIASFDGTSFTHYTVENSELKTNAPFSINADAEGGIWIANKDSNTGVSKFDGTVWTHYNPDTSDFPEWTQARDIVAGANGDYWLSIHSGLLKMSFVTSSNQEQEAFNLLVYPNPAADFIQISTTENVNGEARLTNTEGQLIQVQDFENRTIMDVSSLPSGTYFLQIYGDQGMSVRKLIVE